eukprot:3204441-Pleurochrysis_carterae.AAC.3
MHTLGLLSCVQHFTTSRVSHRPLAQRCAPPIYALTSATCQSYHHLDPTCRLLPNATDLPPRSPPALATIPSPNFLSAAPFPLPFPFTMPCPLTRTCATVANPHLRQGPKTAGAPSPPRARTLAAAASPPCARQPFRGARNTI